MEDAPVEVAPVLKRKATDKPVNAPKIKKIEFVRPAFYTPTPIPFLNIIKAQRDLIEREHKRLQEIHDRPVVASAVVEPIVIRYLRRRSKC